MTDRIELVGKSLLQHGEYNNRIYLLKLNKDDYPQIIQELAHLAQRKGYTKIFAKVPVIFREGFIEEGYEEEAFIPGFYNGKTGASFLGRYLNASRKKYRQEEVKDVLKTSLSRQEAGARVKHGNEENIKRAAQSGTDETKRLSFGLQVATPADIPEMSAVYKRVFATYPFPIHDERYILKTMEENVVYFCIRAQGKIVALSSSEMDPAGENVEMTDFATLPEFRGYGLAVRLLQEMEREMKKRGLKMAYTIARALSYGMNITFAKLGYEYAGTLINNTNISGNLESMNVWYKGLPI